MTGIGIGTGIRTPTLTRPPQRVIDTIFTKIHVMNVHKCWPWKLSLGSHGYGQIGWQMDDGSGRNAGTTAHRVVWLAVCGPIPDGFTVDHVCRNRPCCNPVHLRLRTNVDNATDNGQGAKTHCPSGHEYTYENTRVDKHGWRNCRACMRISNHNRYERKPT